MLRRHNVSKKVNNFGRDRGKGFECSFFKSRIEKILLLICRYKIDGLLSETVLQSTLRFASVKANSWQSYQRIERASRGRSPSNYRFIVRSDLGQTPHSHSDDR